MGILKKGFALVIFADLVGEIGAAKAIEGAGSDGHVEEGEEGTDV